MKMEIQIQKTTPQSLLNALQKIGNSVETHDLQLREYNAMLYDNLNGSIVHDGNHLGLFSDNRLEVLVGESTPENEKYALFVGLVLANKEVIIEALKKAV